MNKASAKQGLYLFFILPNLFQHLHFKEIAEQANHNV